MKTFEEFLNESKTWNYESASKDFTILIKKHFPQDKFETKVTKIVGTIEAVFDKKNFSWPKEKSKQISDQIDKDFKKYGFKSQEVTNNQIRLVKID